MVGRGALQVEPFAARAESFGLFEVGYGFPVVAQTVVDQATLPAWSRPGRRGFDRLAELVQRRGRSSQAPGDQAPVLAGQGESGMQLEQALEGGPGLIVAAADGVAKTEDAARRQEPARVGRQGESPIEVGQGFLDQPQAAAGQAARIVSGGEGGGKRDGSLEILQRSPVGSLAIVEAVSYT